MEQEVLSLFLGSLSSTGAGGVFLLLGGAIIFVLTSLVIAYTQKYFVRDLSHTTIGEMIHASEVLDDGKTIRMHDAKLCQIVHIEGTNTPSLTVTDKQLLEEERTRLLVSLQDTKEFVSISLKVVSLREKGDQTLQPQKITTLNKDSFKDVHPVAESIFTTWHRPFARRFKNEHFIYITINKKTHESRYTLNLFTDRLLADLKKFSPRVLQKDEIYSVFYRLLNPSDRTLKIAQEVKTSAVKSDKSPNYLGDFLAVSRIHLQKNGLLKFEGGGNNLGYLAVLPVTKWGKNCTDELVDTFLAVDSQLTLVQQIVSKNPFLTVRSLEQRQKSSVIRFFAYLGLVTADVVAAQDEEFEEYKSLLSTQSSEQKEIPFDYEIYALLYNEDEYALLESVSALQKKIYQNYQVHILHERNMPTHYFFQSLPGEIKFTRPTLFLSSQVSHLLSIFESPPQGLERTDWGEGAVMVLPQANSNHTYNFNFHVKEDKASPGHTLVIGQTGSGKSFVSHILASMGLRYPNVRVFLLDSHNGAASMVHSLGGKYLDIGGGGAGVESVRLNPLLLDLKKEKNASFLFSWLDTLMASDFQDDEMSRYEKCKNTFLRRLKDEARSNRQLGIVKDFFGADEMSEKIRASIQKFTSGEYRQTFNNEEDGLDFSNNRLFGIEMGQILKHSGMKGADDLINAIVPYITHKIDSVSEDVGGASLIFFDETANLLRNEETKKWFVKQTQQGRKQRQAIIAAFQEPDTIIKSDVSDVIMTNFPRQILFAGMNISKEMANIFQLTDREQFFLQGRMPNSERKILVRARTEDKVESVILDVDFSTIAQQPDAPNIRRIFDTMTEALPLIRRIQNETPAGEDWRSRYWAIK